MGVQPKYLKVASEIIANSFFYTESISRRWYLPAQNKSIRIHGLFQIDGKQKEGSSVLLIFLTTAAAADIYHMPTMCQALFQDLPIYYPT